MTNKYQPTSDLIGSAASASATSSGLRLTTLQKPAVDKMLVRARILSCQTRPSRVESANPADMPTLCTSFIRANAFSAQLVNFKCMIQKHKITSKLSTNYYVYVKRLFPKD